MEMCFTELILSLPMHTVGIKKEERYLCWKWERAAATGSSHSLPKTAGKAMTTKEQTSLKDTQKVLISTFPTSGESRCPVVF